MTESLLRWVGSDLALIVVYIIVSCWLVAVLVATAIALMPSRLAMWTYATIAVANDCAFRLAEHDVRVSPKTVSDMQRWLRVHGLTQLASDQISDVAIARVLECSENMVAEDSFTRRATCDALGKWLESELAQMPDRNRARLAVESAIRWLLSIRATRLEDR
jgi:hypothetical protein